MPTPTNEQLCAEWKQGNRAALDALVKNNLAFVRREANRLADQFRAYQHTDDLVQEGAIGLIEAAERYDQERETGFLTYAAYWVRKRIREYLDSVLAGDIVSLEELAQAEETAAGDFSDSGSPESILIRKETIEELYHAMRTISKRESAYLWYRFGFPDEPESRTRKDTAVHFHLTESRAKATEETALDNMRLELP